MATAEFFFHSENSPKTMACPESKTCPLCKKNFVCNTENITECLCYEIELTTEVKAFIKQNYFDCLCIDCLQELKKRDITDQK
ncbi:MAG: cysteine-rich CWC family protein [Chitinophagaceae bacterium]